MKKVLAGIIASVAMICGMVGVAVPTYAADDVFYDICKDETMKNVWEKAGCNTEEGLAATEDPTFNLIINILNIALGLTAMITVVFIVIGGINFMTSAGDSGKVKKAKDTILYASIGLVICIFAAVIINWVIAKMIIGN